MALDDAVTRILTQCWDDIWSPLDAAQREELAELLRKLTLRISDDGVATVAKQIIAIVKRALPQGHPARAELEDAISESGDSELDWVLLTGALRRFSAHAVRQQARDWLLDSSMLSAEQVRAQGEDPEHPFLIRLDAPDGEPCLPAFQFGPDGRAIDVVLDVNERLDSDADPWGVADWWLGTNAWLNATPADLIGQDAHLVRDAAAAIAAEEW